MSYSDEFFEELKSTSISEIPILKTIHFTVKAGIMISELRLMKNITLFLKEFHNGDLSDEDKNKFLIQLESKKKAQVIENVLIVLEKSREYEMSIIISKLLKKYILIDGDIDKFSEESISLERLYIKDLKLLAALYELKINEGGVVADDSGDNDSFKRLEYEGLINKHIILAIANGYGENFDFFHPEDFVR
ncbi:hypothetical protein [Lachnotalea glycerini]|uniref:Uncharacterized protein n=1 Tax=Lachnotalea glycerini TaxID=1763509 RepID=A0A371JKI8_9FIRM|nr:hypothetical protein [Lachnotalea glycerini]RDY33241.1 hypothetical protein CG710_001580 [Lachnotalea glycerini]